MKIASKRLALFLCTLLLPLINARAATINVGTFEDENFGEGGSCSLRAAVLSANTDSAIGGCTAGSGDDTIVLLAGTYTLTRSCDIDFNNAEINTDSDSNTECDDLDIYGNVTIAGAGKTLTIITVQSDVLTDDGRRQDYSFSVFDIHTENLPQGTVEQGTVEAAGVSSCTEGCTLGTSVLLKDMTIQGAEDTNGGAVRSDSEVYCSYSKLETQNVLFEDNYADRHGGAVYVKGLYVASGTNFDSNIADNLGGGLYLDGNTRCDLTNTILNSTFDSNSSLNDQGGALYSDTDTKVDIAGSTFQNNHAYIAGGAIAGITGTINITNSSISNNGLQLNEKFANVPVIGGGIFIGDLSDFGDLIPRARISASGGDYLGQDGEINLSIQNSSITGNQSLIAGGGIATLDNFFRFIPGFLPSANGGSCDEGIIVHNVNLRDSTVKDNFVQYYQETEEGTETEDVIVQPILFPIQFGGGALHAGFGKFTIQNSTFDANEAAVGGGLANLFEMDIQKSTISNNQALFPNILGFFGVLDEEENPVEPVQFITTINFSGGGGLFNGGAVDVVNSTISGNTTDGSGAGVLNYTDSAYVSIYESLLNPEEPSMDGEGEEDENLPELEPVAAPGTRLNNDTIADNKIVELVLPESQPIPASQVSIAPYYLNNGGGIAALIGKISLANTIVATNKDDFELPSVINESPAPGSVPGALVEPGPTPGSEVDPKEVLGDFAPDCYVLPNHSDFCQVEDSFCDHFIPQIISEQHNLIGNNLGCTAFQPAANTNFDIVGTADAVVDPLIGALANNGGSTLTHFLNKGSPAIDNGSGTVVTINAGTEKGCQPDDQRAVARPIDGNKDNIAVCDIGAVEVSVDCDLVPGGNKVVDSCGVCGGDGTSCIQQPQGEFSCSQQNIFDSLIVLDGSAHDLANLTNALIRTISQQSGKKKKSFSKTQSTAQTLLNQAWNNTWVIPSVITSDCKNTGQKVCSTVSNEVLKADYVSTINQLFDLNLGLLKQLSKLKKLKAKNKARYTALNDKYLATALSTLGNIPASTTSCQ